jgi:hypothetical protein
MFPLKAMKGAVLPLAKFSDWTGRKAWTGPRNKAINVHLQTGSRCTIYSAVVSTSFPTSREDY